jgi:hypothetical protein
MLKKLLLNLQLFGEGGDGGDGGSANPNGEGSVDTSGEDKVLASIPEKARKYYQKAQEKMSQGTQKPSEQTQTTNEPKATEKKSYADLIKSDEYKEEHKAYMDKTIGDRLKKYKGMEDDLGKHRGLLEIVANKYGVSPDDENFLEVLQEKIEADDSYYENYAMEHDISTEKARELVTMERKVARIEAQEQEAEKERQRQQHIMTLHQNAEKTKARFPEFDLNTAMQNESFRRICAATNGDTTAAYMACNWNNVIPAQVQMASQQIKQQTAQAVASNLARPIENGTSSTPSSVVKEDFRGMNLQQIRAYADEQRRKKNGR